MGAEMYYKKYIEKIITQDPKVITIKRQTKGNNNGFDGGITTEELPPQTVTFYNKKAQREIVKDKGGVIGYNASNALKMISRGDADIQEGDTFIYNNKTFRVIFVGVYGDICKQIELEVIKYG